MPWKTLSGNGFSSADFASVLVRPNLLRQLLGRSLHRPLIDEQIWTLVFTSGFRNNPGLLYKILCETESHPPDCKAWLEMLPLPPRKGEGPRESEGNTNIDLVLGAIAKRDGTQSGVQFDPTAGRGICLVEAKWLSDIAYRTTHDHKRNQFARLIEVACTLQHHVQGKSKSKVNISFPDEVHVSLLTPAAFKTKGCQSRLYGYKFDEYSNDPQRAIDDVAASSVPQRRSSPNWEYPDDVATRIRQARLHWVTYEDLFRGMPPGGYKELIRGFVKDYGSDQRGKKGILDMNAF